MGPYDELLQSAAGLGFQISAASSSSSEHLQTVTKAQQLVDQCQSLHELELRLAALSAHSASRIVTDQEQLAARTAALSNAASTLHLICSNKDVVADRLRSASTRPSVPVAPEYQPDFSELLQYAASNADVLQGGMQALQWAAALDDKPSCWEDQLRVIRESAQGIKDYMNAMEEFSAALKRWESSYAPHQS